MLDLISQWVAHYGYLLVALFLFVEAAGVPIPGETALVTAAALAGRGTLSIVGVVIAGFIGTAAGGHAGYWLGVRGGQGFVERHGKWMMITPTVVAKTRQFFEQHGAKTMLAARFIAFVRSFVGFFAGMSGMPMREFALYNAAGSVIWIATFTSIGFLFGRNLPRLVHFIGRVGLLAAIFIALVAGVVFLWRWFAANRTSVVATLDRTFEHRASTPRMTDLRAQHPTAWRLRQGRFAQSQYLALHLVIGFAVSLAVIGIFASITEGLVDSSPLTRFDVVVAARLRESVSASAMSSVARLSGIGGRGAMS